MAARNGKKLAGGRSMGADVFDRSLLRRYTLDSYELEREVIKLFLDQLPVTLTMLKNVTSQADWKLATHTLKGSAAAVGATHINQLAYELEQLLFIENGPVAKRKVADLEAAAEQFKEAVARVYR